MSVSLLISAVNADEQALLEKMNIEEKVVLVNQCGINYRKSLTVNGYECLVIGSDKKGVGVSRNECIENATEDILMFSDDDIVYDSGHSKLIAREFAEHPEADAILFNVRVCEDRQTYWNDSFKKVGRFSCGRFPAYSIAVKKSAIDNSGVRFSTLFGGGCKYSNGEDSLFLTDMLRAGVRIYKTPVVIGEEIYRESTWFSGYTEKFFYDRGVLFSFLYGRLAVLFAVRFLTKSYMYKGSIGRKQAFSLLLSGIREGKKEKRNAD